MISDAQIEQYNTEGYTIVENVFPQDDLQPVLDEFDQIVDEFAEKAFKAGKIQNKHSDKNVFIFDEYLSAVDAKTSKIIHNYVLEYLKTLRRSV